MRAKLIARLDNNDTEEIGGGGLSPAQFQKAIPGNMG